MTCKEEWKSLGSILLRPSTLFFLLLAIGCLASQMYTDEHYKVVIYLLQILASVSAGVLGGLVTDRYKEITGNTILWKKGISSVRNLALIRHKSRKIILRIKTSNNKEETINLIDFLEKDIANVSREWEDIIPGITKEIDFNYYALSAMDVELEQALKDKKQFRIEELQKQIAELENKAANVNLSSMSVSGMVIGGTVRAQTKKCVNCQQEYQSPWSAFDIGICPKCNDLKRDT